MLLIFSGYDGSNLSNITLLTRFKPIIYVPKEDPNCQLIDVLYEVYPNYIILWFHWPNDDYTGKEDYEPVILVFKDQQLVVIGIRPHNKYKHAVRWVAEGSRPIIVFATSWHGPIINHGRVRDALAVGFSLSMVSQRKDDYRLVAGAPQDWYVKADSSMPVYDFANKIARDAGAV